MVGVGGVVGVGVVVGGGGGVKRGGKGVVKQGEGVLGRGEGFGLFLRCRRSVRNRIIFRSRMTVRRSSRTVMSKRGDLSRGLSVLNIGDNYKW